MRSNQPHKFIGFLFIGVLLLSIGFAAHSSIAPKDADFPVSYPIPEGFYLIALVPQDFQRGILTRAIIIARGGNIAESWDEARELAEITPPDGFLLDNHYLQNATAQDRKWLYDLARDGVVLVGLGVDDDQFAQAIGLETFRATAEGIYELAPYEYRKVYASLLTTPEARANIKGDWFAKVAHAGEHGPFLGVPITTPVTYSYSSGKASLINEGDIDVLFYDFSSLMEGHKTRQLAFEEASATELRSEPLNVLELFEVPQEKV